MQSMASGRVSLSSGLKVSELKDKLAELGLSTQGNKDILRERLHSFLDAGSSNEQDIHVENPPNETKMVAATLKWTMKSLLLCEPPQTPTAR